MATPIDYSGISGAGSSTSMNNPDYQKMTMDTRWRLLYPAPYFDPIAMQTIMDPKIMMHWGRYFYDWHPIIHAAINKMAAYPITDFVFETEDPALKKVYEELFEKINVRSILVRMGLDYFVLGNSYFSLSMPFKRLLHCPECGSAAALTEDTKFKVTSRGYVLTCPHCGKTVTPEIKDVATKNFKDIHPILWDPLNMKVEYDEMFGTSDYFYSIPGQVSHDLEMGNKRAWSLYPMQIIEAARAKQLFQLNSNKILHLKRWTHSSAYNKGYGQPLISPVLKYLFHLLVLIRAQDALAIDQILPWTIISPSSNGSIDPAGDINLNQFSSSLEMEYKQWKKNPMRKSIMPIPVNAQIVGAQGKALMLTNEIQEITNQILAGMSVPNEFVYGGLQWSGANVSMRMLENQFINYRNMMQEVINYIVKECSINFGIAEIKVYMQPFKMADDVAQKDLLIRLSEGMIISKHTVMSELMNHLDFDKEQDLIMKEMQKQQEQQVQQQIVAQNTQAMYGIQAPQPQMPGDMGDQQHGDLPEQNPPQAQGANAQV